MLKHSRNCVWKNGGELMKFRPFSSISKIIIIIMESWQNLLFKPTNPWTLSLVFLLDFFANFQAFPSKMLFEWRLENDAEWQNCRTWRNCVDVSNDSNKYVAQWLAPEKWRIKRPEWSERVRAANWNRLRCGTDWINQAFDNLIIWSLDKC